jgi:hypothetical protein
VTGWPIATSAAAVLALALAAHAAAACPLQPEDGQAFAAAANGRAEAAGPTPVQAAWRVQGAASPQTLPPTAKPFSLRLKLCPADARLLRVDATMPEHRHGMNYRASFQPLGEGVWQAQGLLWHMAGRWQLRLDVQPAGQGMPAQILLADVRLP